MFQKKTQQLRKLEKVLIANRGEIAIRVIRACKEMGIIAATVYSDADADALHVRIADEAINIGQARANDSYLNVEHILNAALACGADAIHPGVGFLSENSDFDRIVSESGLKFIGPTYDVIEKLGNKSTAREIAKKAGAPIVPGSDGPLKDVEEALKLADKIGYPVMIKAVSGGGGRGIRIVETREQLEDAYESAKKEAVACFGDDSLYIEKMILGAKHIEVQILADEYGNVVHLGERDCSIQRKNQKVVEEAPCETIDSFMREKMGKAAVNIAKTAGYQNSGTVEFLMTDDKKFYFIEMNTRIQVEHTVTEMITGVDIVKEQLRIARGERLSYKQQDIIIRGHSIECRINAEDADNRFMPNCGKINMLYVPGGMGVRFEGCIYDGCEISPYYDSMIGKVIVYGKDRQEAINKMKCALGEIVVEGIKTNINFQKRIMNNQKYLDGDFNTGFIRQEMNV